MNEQNLGKQLVDALARLKISDTVGGRLSLLAGVDDADAIRRDENYKPLHLHSMVGELSERDRRSDQGDPQLVILIDNALQYTKGAELGREFETLRAYALQRRIVLSPPAKPSRLHLRYLRHWFSKPWARVNLADISQSQERASLLDVYVPLPVKFALDLVVKGQRIVDWQVHREGGNEEARPQTPGRGGPMERESAPQRSWAEMGVEEADLQRVVDHFQTAIDAERAQGRPIKDGTHTRALESLHAASLQPRFVLLGEPGGGKSSFLRHLTLCLAGEVHRRGEESDVPAHASLAGLDGWLLDAASPIYIELRGLVAGAFPPLDGDAATDWTAIFWGFVRGQTLSGPGLADFDGELEELCAAGRAILLLDGLDEIPLAGNPARQKQVRAFVAALVQSYPAMRIVISSRPHAYRPGEWALDGFGRAELDHLDWPRLSQLAQALFAAVNADQNGGEADAFVQAIRSDPHIEPGLHRNPLFFTLLAALWLRPGPQRRLPTTRADLYRQATDLLLGRWTRRRALDPSLVEQMDIPPEQLRPILDSLACTITEQSAAGQDSTHFGIETLLGILYHSGIRTGLHDVPDYLTQQAGILVSPGPRTFAFVHRSFQEHLAACELTHDRPDERTPPVAAERRFPAGLVNRVLARPDLWENVVGLAADELLARQREGDIWRLLVEMVTPYLSAYRSSTSQKKSNFSDGAQAAFLALEIAHRHSLFVAERDPFDPLAHSFELLRQTALALLVDYQHFAPEQRLIAGQLLGSRPGLDTRKGVGVVETLNVETQNFASLPDIDWVKIPEVDAEGRREFIYQKDERRTEPDFWMARYPITYAQFQCFVEAADGWAKPEWWDGLSVPNEQKAKPFEQLFKHWNHPRENVSWYQAIAFCRWLTAQALQHPELLPEEMRDAKDWRITLPTEWQWEKAARSYDGQQYPWGGDTYQPSYANINETYGNAGPHYLQTTSAVGMYPQGASPYGIADMSGNVWEWCLNEYRDPEETQESGSETRVLRGGSWGSYLDYAAAVRRNGILPLSRLNGLGFWVVLIRAVSNSVPRL